MSYRNGNKSVLRFRVHLERPNPLSENDKTPWQLLNTVAWMGKEPKSCRVIDIKQAAAAPMSKAASSEDGGSLIDHAEYLVLVGYRPHGWISNVKNNGRDRLNGWQVEIRDQMNDGTLLDGKGQPLPLGSEPVFLKFEQNHYADFNEYEFGEFLGESEDDPALSSSEP
jgi:hypothetical protein